MKNKTLVIFLVCLTLIICLQKQPLLSQTTEIVQTQSTNQTESAPNKRSIWEAILNIFQRRKGPSLTSRSFICAISPGLMEETPIIWSEQPLFLFLLRQYYQQGFKNNFLKIQLSTGFDMQNPLKPDEVFWEEKVELISSETSFVTQIEYTGPMLESGQNYKWEVRLYYQEKPDEAKNSFSYDLQIMDKEQRNKISQDLQSLETRLKAEGKSQEDIIIAKFEYFANQQLWTDGLQVIYTASQEFPELKQKIQEISKYVCPQEG